jgi:predicted ArsR family transcriptional regulator
MLKLPPGLEYEPDPIEVRYRRNLRGLLHRIRQLYDAVADRFGEDGLQLIREVSIEYGRDVGRRIREREGLMDVKRAGMFIIKVFNNMRAEGEVLEFSDERVVISVPKCPYPMDRADVCDAHITMEEALVAELNPELEFILEQSLPRGDKACLYIIRQKKR